MQKLYEIIFLNDNNKKTVLLPLINNKSADGGTRTPDLQIAQEDALRRAKSSPGKGSSLTI
jgi:hypothetical protein